MVNFEPGISTQEVAPHILLPTPSTPNLLSPRKVQAWLDKEIDPRFRALKMKMVDNITRVSFDDFSLGVKETASRVDTEVGNRPYAVLWDYKPHSSRRWVYELARKYSSAPPSITTYEPGKTNEQAHDRLIAELVRQGIRDFVVWDDAIYSGEQMINHTIRPLIRFAKAHTDVDINLLLAAPYTTKRFLESGGVNTLIKTGAIKSLHRRTMQTLNEIFTKDEWDLLETRNGGTLDAEEDAFDIVTDETLTFFDHRIGDDHSFNPSCARLIDRNNGPPYREKGTDYFKQEDKEFESFKTSHLQQ